MTQLANKHTAQSTLRAKHTPVAHMEWYPSIYDIVDVLDLHGHTAFAIFCY